MFSSHALRCLEEVRSFDLLLEQAVLELSALRVAEVSLGWGVETFVDGGVHAFCSVAIQHVPMELHELGELLSSFLTHFDFNKLIINRSF